jgi:hypothetical protein
MSEAQRKLPHHVWIMDPAARLGVEYGQAWRDQFDADEEAHDTAKSEEERQSARERFDESWERIHQTEDKLAELHATTLYGALAQAIVLEEIAESVGDGMEPGALPFCAALIRRYGRSIRDILATSAAIDPTTWGSSADDPFGEPIPARPKFFYRQRFAFEAPEPVDEAAEAAAEKAREEHIEACKAVFVETFRKAYQEARAEDAEGMRLIDNYNRAMDLYAQQEALYQQQGGDPDKIDQPTWEKMEELGAEAFDLLDQIGESTGTGFRVGIAKLRAAAHFATPCQTGAEVFGPLIKSALAAFEHSDGDGSPLEELEQEAVRLWNAAGAADGGEGHEALCEQANEVDAQIFTAPCRTPADAAVKLRRALDDEIGMEGGGVKNEEYDALIGILEMLERMVGKPAYETRPIMKKTGEGA